MEEEKKWFKKIRIRKVGGKKNQTVGWVEKWSKNIGLHEKRTTINLEGKSNDMVIFNCLSFSLLNSTPNERPIYQNKARTLMSL